MMRKQPPPPIDPLKKPIPKTPPRVSVNAEEKKGFFSFLKKKQPVPVGQSAQQPEPKPQKPKKDILTPFKEELTYEWKWLMKKLRIYDYDKEEENLLAYRKLRGWE